jgi:flavin-dependent dehydrogenase
MMQEKKFDVVIIGAGFAGNCQARHLLLNIPNIRIALIDRRSIERTEKDLKVGESTVEISAMFLYKELGLHEYLIENHVPKHGLNFHWPKDQNCTEKIDDYYHVWTNRPPTLPGFQLNRAKLESDLLRMNCDNGVTFYNGRVISLDLTPHEQLKRVKIKLADEVIDIQASHVIDAAGRSFLIGKHVDNMIFDPEKLYGINTGSAWLRVKGVDKSVFHSGYDPLNSTASHYYGTNHWMGYGHWIWMIPIDTETSELSIGLVHHHNVIKAGSVNTKEKLLDFLEANHKIVSSLVKSGEPVDFHYLPRLAHTSKMMFSPDNWYVIGDAAQMFDAFYSPGLVMTTFAIESVTKIIAAKLENNPKAEQMRETYNEFNLAYAKIYNRVYQFHDAHIGHAGVMSWRIYLENMFWFGFAIPMYAGKWHLDLLFAKSIARASHWLISGPSSIYSDFYLQFNRIIERNAKIRLLDMSRSDQLYKGYVPTKFFDDFVENTKFEIRATNIFSGSKATFFHAALLYAKLRFEGFGLLDVLTPKSVGRITQLFFLALIASFAELAFKLIKRNTPSNHDSLKMRQEFYSDYLYQPKLQPWNQEKC